MDKNLTKVNKNPVSITMAGRQEWEEMKKHSGSFLMDHADESQLYRGETKESEEKEADGPAFPRLGHSMSVSFFPA